MKMNIGRVSVQITAFATIFILLSFTPKVNKTNKFLFGIFEYGDFTKKSYYNTIFDADEIQKLSKINEGILKENKLLSKTDKDLKEYSAYMKIVNLSKNEKDKKKAQKGADKVAKKVLKASSKSIEQISKLNDQKYSIYNNKFSKYTFDQSPEHKASKDSMNFASKTYDVSKGLMKSSASKPGMEQFLSKKDAIAKQQQAIRTLELAFGLYYKDTEFQLSPQNKVVNGDNKKTEPEEKYQPYTSNYNSNADSNLYKSKESLIISKLKLLPADELILKDIAKKEQQADQLKLEIETEYIKVERLHQKASTKADRIEKERLTSEAVDAEKNIFFKQLKAVTMYIEINEQRYKIYKKYYEQVRPPKEDKKYSEGAVYEKSADKYFSESNSIAVDANLKSAKHLKYMRLCDAILYQLSAIQQQENAYCVYLDLPVSKLGEITIVNPGFQTVVENTADNKSNQKKNNNKSSNKTDNKNKTTNKKDNPDTGKYKYVSTMIYSVENPKPVKVTKNDPGIIFKVQAGFFKDNLDIVKYAKYSPISFDTFKDNEYKRFMFGNYQTVEASEYVLSEAKKTFKDAFIIAYVGGKRTDFEAAKKKVKKDDKYKKNVITELNSLKGKVEVVKEEVVVEKIEKQDDKKETVINNQTTEAVSTDDITTSKGLVYSVQVGFYSTKKTSQDLKMLSPIYYDKSEKGYKYMVGKYDTYEAAEKQKDQIKKTQFENAYIVAYYNGKPVSINEAAALSGKKTQEKELKEVKEDVIFFTVQIGAYALKLTEAEQKMFDAISKKHKIITRKSEGGLTTYSVGEEKTYESVKSIKEQLVKDGYKDVFITAYKNDKKIDVAEAVKLLKK